MNQLPEIFLDRMKQLLQDEYPAFYAGYNSPHTQGLRVNTLKLSCQEFESICPFPIHKIPWVDNGYFYDKESRPSRHPFYQAGLYYLQEPSAMTPASRLPVTPGEYVLDLCAAPGGKATELGAKLKGRGLLVANDISTSRARALLRNIELMGISNAFVTNEVPAKMAPVFTQFFHKILLDAPCSGEGMFRKEPAVADAWTPDKPEEMAKIQRELITHAVHMLRPGGLLLYSTCTFAPVENEGTIAYALEQFPDLEILPIDPYEGFSPGVPQWGNNDSRLKNCVRIWPHKMNGEGHFLALLKKPGTLTPPMGTVNSRPDKASVKLIEEFLSPFSLKAETSRLDIRKDKVYLLPPAPLAPGKITFLRNGVYMGDLKKNRFEPAQPFALALDACKSSARLCLAPHDERLIRYLKGETLLLSPEECPVKKGWILVCAGAYPLGWGKLVNQTVKNKYPAGWRIN